MIDRVRRGIKSVDMLQAPALPTYYQTAPAQADARRGVPTPGQRMPVSDAREQPKHQEPDADPRNVRHAQSPESVKAELEALFRSHHQIIWRTLRRLGVGPEAAADYTQQAFVITAERYSRVHPGAEKAFLFATAIGLARSARRRDWRCQLEADMETHWERLNQDEQASRTRYARELASHILSSLDSDLVTVFLLYELEGYSGPEIAEMLQVPVGTVASRLRRARDAFREQASRLETAPPGGQPQ